MTCSRCGECCRWIAVRMFGLGSAWQEYHAARGAQYLYRDPDGHTRTSLQFEGKKGLEGLLVPSRCPHLKYLVKPGASAGQNCCDIFEKRPHLCHTGNDGLEYWRPDGCTL